MHMSVYVRMCIPIYVYITYICSSEFHASTMGINEPRRRIAFHFHVCVQLWGSVDTMR